MAAELSLPERLAAAAGASVVAAVATNPLEVLKARFSTTRQTVAITDHEVIDKLAHMLTDTLTDAASRSIASGDLPSCQVAVCKVRRSSSSGRTEQAPRIYQCCQSSHPHPWPYPSGERSSKHIELQAKRATSPTTCIQWGACNTTQVKQKASVVCNPSISQPGTAGAPRFLPHAQHLPEDSVACGLEQIEIKRLLICPAGGNYLSVERNSTCFVSSRANSGNIHASVRHSQGPSTAFPGCCHPPSGRSFSTYCRSILCCALGGA